MAGINGTASIVHGGYATVGLSSPGDYSFQNRAGARDVAASFKARILTAGEREILSSSVAVLSSRTERTEYDFPSRTSKVGTKALKEGASATHNKSRVSGIRGALVSVCSAVREWFARLLGKGAPSQGAPTAIWYDREATPWPLLASHDSRPASLVPLSHDVPDSDSNSRTQASMQLGKGEELLWDYGDFWGRVLPQQGLSLEEEIEVLDYALAQISPVPSADGAAVSFEDERKDPARISPMAARD